MSWRTDTACAPCRPSRSVAYVRASERAWASPAREPALTLHLGIIIQAGKTLDSLSGANAPALARLVERYVQALLRGAALPT